MTVGRKDVGVHNVIWPSGVLGMLVLLLMRPFREILPERLRQRGKVARKDCQRESERGTKAGDLSQEELDYSMDSE